MSVLPEKILVATDGSEQAGRATRTAAELAGKLGAELHLIYVGEPPVVFHPEMRGYTALYERSEQDGRKLLEEEAERIRASGATVARSHLRMGRSDVQLLAVAGEIGAGMLVVGSRGLGGVKRALMAAYPTPWFITRTARCSSRGRKWSSVTLRCISPVRTDN